MSYGPFKVKTLCVVADLLTLLDDKEGNSRERPTKVAIIRAVDKAHPDLVFQRRGLQSHLCRYRKIYMW